LMRVLCSVGSAEDANFMVCDAFACVGGNALAFARLNFSVVAMEVPYCSLQPQTPSQLSPNPSPQLLQSRASMLLHNVAVCRASSVSVLCADAARASQLMRRSPHVLFLDPPWPSPTQTPPQPLTDIPLLHSSPSIHLSHFFRHPHLRASAAVVAAKLPLTFDVDALARDLTSQELECGPLTTQRPFPFIFSFGAIRLFVALYPQRYCLPSLAAAATPPLQFCNGNLDAVICAVRAWNAVVASGPRFFDYEAGKWIALSKWRKCSMP
jgi:hypothetical protein